MKFSEQWLREWVSPDLTTQALADQLSLSGLEVDDVTAVAEPFSQVVVAQIVSCEQHPDADKLKVCQVTDGRNQYQVVCGATNARAGLKTAFAQVGAVLPGNFKIKRAKLRGIESLGMLCAEDELGISDDHAGIMELANDAPLGEDLRQYLFLDDSVIDVDLTPNRADCLSVQGIAREVSVLNNVDMCTITPDPVPAQIEETFPVKLTASQACPRYVGRVIRHINVQAKTPLWMREKLRRSGIRSIDPVVDVTNYVMLELGQPMHAFDLDLLKDAIEVRYAQDGESLELLNGQRVTFADDQTLLITDGNGPLAMAGIMGGEGSGVSHDTQHIFLESAFFSPLAIVGRARKHGLHTDSSHRFERGVDWQLQIKAIERATQLLLSIVGGQPGPVQEVTDESNLPDIAVISLRQEKINSLLAFDFPPQQVETILKRLGMDVLNESEQLWRVTAPSWRFDIQIEVDLIEELARVYGYDNLPVKTPSAALPIQPKSEALVNAQWLKQHLISRDYQEAITYSFIDAELSLLFDPEHQPMALANPISKDMAVMRTSLWPGLIKALQQNLNRQQQRVRLFEMGQRFINSTTDLIQEDVIAGIICGARHAEGWSSDNTAVDFFDLKGDVESLLAMRGEYQQSRFSPCQHPALHPGQSAAIVIGEETIGFLGALHPQIMMSLDIKYPVYLFEIVKSKVEKGLLPRYSPLSRFPEVKRDLSFVVNQDVSYDTIYQVILEAAGESLTHIRLFDIYEGQHIEQGRKSLALSLTWQHLWHTLKEEEINSCVTTVIDSLTSKCGATLRD